MLLASLRVYWPPRRFGRVYIVLDNGEAAGEAMAQRLLTKYGGEELRQDTDTGEWRVTTSRSPAPSLVGRSRRHLLRGRAANFSSYGGGASHRQRGLASSARSHLDDPLLTITYAACGGYTFCQRGYHQQQYDTINADAYVPERYPGAHPDEPPNSVIGIADTDALLVTLPHEHTFFDEAGRPRVIPRVQLPFGQLWSEAAVSTQWLLGVPEPFRGMSYFPVYVYRAHLVALRTHIYAVHNRTADQLWDQMVAVSRKRRLVERDFFVLFF